MIEKAETATRSGVTVRVVAGLRAVIASNRNRSARKEVHSADPVPDAQARPDANRRRRGVVRVWRRPPGDVMEVSSRSRGRLDPGNGFKFPPPARPAAGAERIS